MIATEVKPETRAADTGGVGLSANAFSDVYREHMPELTRYCRSILRDGHDAEDAAQAAMERAFKALSSGPAPDRMRPWLFTIAQRESVNVLRRRGRDVPVELDKMASVSATGSPEELAAVRERLAELLSDLRELAPRQREVLVARELGGHSYKEIASSVGTTEAAAQQLVLEARQSLAHFESGRSLECDSVQRWISARDHARVRTRRVSAHLRSCPCCRGFRESIRARRRDLALLLPGLGGGAGWLSPLAALFGPAGGVAKLAATGAVVVAGLGVGLTATSPVFDDDRARDGVPVERSAAAAVATPAPVMITARFQGAGAAPASGSAGRSRSSSRSGAPRAAAQRPRPSSSPAATGEAAGAGAPVTAEDLDAARRPRVRPKPAATQAPASAPDSGSGSGSTGPVQAPAAVVDVVGAVQPVVDETVSGVTETVETVKGTVDEVVDSVAGAVPTVTPKLPLGG